MSLLLRSPQGEDYGDRVDVMFRGTAAIRLVWSLDHLVVRVATPAERESVTAECGDEVMWDPDLVIFMVEGGHTTGYVVAYLCLMSIDRRHWASSSPLLWDAAGDPPPTEPRYGYVP